MSYAVWILKKLKLFKNNTLNENTLDGLLKFSVDVVFTESSDTINIENKYDCNAESLRVCLLNDPLSLFGCKELTVGCHHFETDIVLKKNGQTIPIPANKTSNEGYALAITNLTEACNTFHGDFVLVTANVESNDYMLICQCKNPGYIGNDNLLGNCETIRICGGNIDDINKPLDQINCQCNELEKSVRYEDGLPKCKLMTIKEANETYSDWSQYVKFNSDRLIRVGVYNRTIVQNLKTSLLLNPCTNSQLDTTQEIIGASYSVLQNTCRFSMYGLPIRNNLLDTPLGKYSHLDGGIATTNQWGFVRLSGSNSGVRSFGAIKATVDWNSKVSVVVLPQNFAYGEGQQLDLVPKSGQLWVPHCRSVGLTTWNCYIETNVDHLFRNHIPRTKINRQPVLFTDEALWNAAETIFNDGFVWDFTDRLGLKFNQKKITGSHNEGINHPGYGLLMAQSGDYGLLGFENSNDFNLHKTTITTGS